MGYRYFDNEIARLAVLQRIELATPSIMKIRKFFGRYLFTNFLTKFFLSKNEINNKYYNLMLNEYNFLNKHVSFKGKKILSVGSGISGLEILIDYFNDGNYFSIIEKNYISKKIKYGWDDKNFEAYNGLEILRRFLDKNKFKSEFKIYDYDKDIFPDSNFDIIISLFSLDYHYDFNLYKNYFQKISTSKTQIIFDTIRPEYFRNIFNDVKIISETNKKIHSSKRIICKGFNK